MYLLHWNKWAQVCFTVFQLWINILQSSVVSQPISTMAPMVLPFSSISNSLLIFFGSAINLIAPSLLSSTPGHQSSAGQVLMASGQFHYKYFNITLPLDGNQTHKSMSLSFSTFCLIIMVNQKPNVQKWRGRGIPAVGNPQSIKTEAQRVSFQMEHFWWSLGEVGPSTWTVHNGVPDGCYLLFLPCFSDPTSHLFFVCTSCP